MALHAGPLVLLTDGTSLAALPGLLMLASALDCPCSILDVSGAERSPISDARIAAIMSTLPPDAQQSAPSVTTVSRNDDIASVLRDRAGATGGIVAFQPARQGKLSRWVGGNEIPRILHRGFSVLALPPDGTLPPISRVLFPIDLSPRSDDPLDQTIELCRTLAAELHLLHVFGGDRLLPSEQDIAARKMARSPLELLRVDQQHIHRLAERSNERNVRTLAHTAEGRARAEILRYAAEQRIDLIVMATHGPRTLEDMVLGTTTAQVVHGASTPVLAMRSRPKNSSTSAA
jgi:nucleotide-binding universal stress UspA family protein